MVESRIERGDKIEIGRRSYISSRALSAAAFAADATTFAPLTPPSRR
jgi:hypothetical protein